MAGGLTSGTPASPPKAPRARRLVFSTQHLTVAAAAVVVVIIAAVILVSYRGGSERREYDAILKTSLDKVVTAQEGFYYDSTRYVASLRALPTVQLPSGVHIQLFNPDRRSWWGVATHDRLPARHCVVWVGTAPTSLPLEARAPENETKPLCYDDAGVARQAGRS
jgi:hypothetical protein